jgi:hypothetical protein
MDIPIESIEELRSTVKDALVNCNSADFDEIQTRRCHSDSFDTGVEVTIRGSRIAIVPIVEAVTTLDEWSVETITASDHAVQKFNDGELAESYPGAEIYFPYNAEDNPNLFIQ